MKNYTHLNSTVYRSSLSTLVRLLVRLGVDCEALTVGQFTELAMALENADLDWDWARIELETDDSDYAFDRNKRINEARAAVAAVDAKSITAMRSAYIFGFYDDYGI